MKKICLLISLITVFSACSSKKKEVATTASDVIPVSVISLQQESITRPIQASGVFTTEDETYLGFKIGGVIQHVFVKEGDAVKAGQALAVMEAMKMEHTVASPSDGTVAELLYAPGDQVAEGAPLLRLAVQAA